MATLSPSSDQAADLLQNLSLDSKPKAVEIQEPGKKGQVIPGSEVERSLSPYLPPYIPEFVDPSVWFVPNGYPSPYYYAAGAGNEWGDFAQYGNTDGVDASGVYGYNSQLYQHYPYPYFQPLTPTNGPFTANQPASTQVELPSAVVGDQKPLPAETAKPDSGCIGNNGAVQLNKGSTPYKPLYQNSSFSTNGRSFAGIVPGGYQNSRYGAGGQYKGRGVPSSYSKASYTSSGKKYNTHQNSNLKGSHHPVPMSGMGSTGGFTSGFYPNKYCGYGYSGYNSRPNAHGWLAVDYKYKPGGHGNGFFSCHMDGMNELTRGPRVKDLKNQKSDSPTALTVNGQILPSTGNTMGKDETPMTVDRKQYNKADFPVSYNNAKFFIIKSYSEDDVHKSIKYSVWSSTQNGNKKLNAAYQEAQQNSDGCPVFLFFSVNSSWQFVGLAEMVGPVDFDKSVEYWQQDKWTGSFPLKWHIVKDVPNSSLKYIILENNENKPVTNSRDTQEVKLEQGLEMIKIFKDHPSKTCLLDDFGFYEKREKVIKENKAWQQLTQSQKKAGERESLKVVFENGSITKTGDNLVANKQVAREKMALANGIANSF